jgi:hypothetical protein
MVKHIVDRLAITVIRKFRRIPALLTLGFWLAIQGCSGGPPPQVIFGRQADSLPRDRSFDLIVGLDGRGNLTLNHIETGTLDDISQLNEKVGAVFEDRQRFGITGREIVVEMNGPIARPDLERLLGSLRRVGVSQITIVTK